ncbi:hypothetical protein D3C75_1017070 [compost metagenome]
MRLVIQRHYLHTQLVDHQKRDGRNGPAAAAAAAKGQHDCGIVGIIAVLLAIAARRFLHVPVEFAAACGKPEADLGDGHNDAAVRGFHRIADDGIHIHHFFDIFHCDLH